MGLSLARVGAELGAEVILIKGPTNANINHINIKQIDVVSADEMLEEVLNYREQIDIGIFAAAVSDFKPKKYNSKKIKKSDGFNEIKLTLNKDILLEFSKFKKDNQFIVGFALESNNEIDNAIKKLEQKKLDLIVLNSLNDENAGFGYDTNKISIIDSNKQIEDYKLKPKYEVAKDIFNKIIKEI